MLLTDRIALVTGAGQGIGKATAVAFAQEGAQVVAVDINGEAAEKTAPEVTALGRRGLALQASYAASKGAVISLIRIAALQLAQQNINVNAICPGVTRTALSGANSESEPRKNM